MKKIVMLLLVLFSGVVYSAEQLTIIVPFAPGGPIDSVARVLQNYLPGEIGKTVVIVNKPGASGIIATDYVIENKNKSIVLLHSPALFINQLTDNGKYDVNKDLRPVGYFGYYPFVLLSSNKFPYKNLKTWNNLPDGTTINIGNGGVGTTSYLSNKLLEKNFKKIDFVDVNYGAGGAGVIPDLLSGNIDVTMSYGAVFESLIESNKIYPIAVANPSRIKYLPNVPTLKELNIFETYVNNHCFLYMSSGVDKAEAEKIRVATRKLMKNPKFIEALAKSGVEIPANSTENYDKLLSSQFNFFKKVIEEVK